jgi:hypothetical protein
MDQGRADAFMLDAIRDAFNDTSLRAKDIAARMSVLSAELRRIEALSSHNEYVIHEEEDLFD